jgi:hypothetical protein
VEARSPWYATRSAGASVVCHPDEYLVRPTTPGLVRLLHGPDADIRNLGSSRQGYGIEDHAGDVLRLQQQLGPVFCAALGIQGGLPRSLSATALNAA